MLLSTNATTYSAAADPMYAALSPRAPAFVDAPSFAFGTTCPAPSRSELLRAQIVAAQQMRGPASLYR